MTNKDTLIGFITRLMNIDGTVDDLPLSGGSHLWRKLTAKNGTFIEYVVSSDANTYPDGGLFNGHYYEKANGLTGVDCGTISLSASQESITVNHKLNKAPSLMALIPISGGDAVASTTFMQIASTRALAEYNKMLSMYFDSSNADWSYNANVLLLEGTETTATLTARSTSYKFGPYTYLWVVFAL